MNYFQWLWSRVRGKEDVPTFGAQIALLGGAFGLANRDDAEPTPDSTPADSAAADYGWSGEHMSGGSDFGGGAGGFDGGGFDGGGGSN